VKNNGKFPKNEHGLLFNLDEKYGMKNAKFQGVRPCHLTGKSCLCHQHLTIEPLYPMCYSKGAIRNRLPGGKKPTGHCRVVKWRKT